MNRTTMFGRYRSTYLPLYALMALGSLMALPLAAQNAGSVTGQITDETGASIPAASVSVLKAGAIVRTVQTNEQGVFNAPNIPAGNYTVRIGHFGFTTVELKVPITPGQKATVNSQLKLAAEAQSVTVQADSVGTVSVDASQNANALVLKQAEIDALPDDPDDLASDLQQLAGPAAGPNGGQIYIDGFTGGRLPPKESIREIRINQNPFSSEYDKLGYGRIEILTKPGSDKWHGQAFINDSDGSFNARNPFIFTQPDFSSRQYGGNITGALNKKTSIFFDIEERDIDDNGIIVAQTLNSNFVPTALNEAIATPQKRLDFSPRVDYQLNEANTLVVKYSFLRNTITDSGVGQFSLATQGLNETSFENSLQVTETAVLSPKAINETRFRWLRDNETDTAATPGATINVADSFVGGGNSTPKTVTGLTNFELQNYTSLSEGAHSFKFGLRIRSYQASQNSPGNFLGTFTFAGGLAPELDANNQPVLNSTGGYIMQNETSIEQYRRTLLFQSEGLSTAVAGQLGGLPSQYSVSAGNPYAAISELDAGLFFQDDWRIRPNLTVNFGLRYEIQNQISDFRDWAPRFGFAWSPDSKGNKQGKTVIRGGAGIFYDRLGYQYPFNAEIYNGRTIQRYVITNPTFFTNDAPSASTLVADAVPQTIQQVDPNFHAEYNIQTAIGIERALPHNTRVSLNYLNTHGVHMYRTVNINAPDPYLNNEQPYGAAAGNIYNYESDGFFRQNQLILTVNTAFTKNVSLFSFYQLNYASSDTDGIGTFPGNQYNFGDDYSRAQFDTRHRVFLGGSVTAKYAVRFSPFIVYHSSSPFNITDGFDYLESTTFTERPAFTSAACGTADVVCTPYGKFTTNPQPGDVIIPRNYGNGPGYFSVNLRVSKTWGFGERSGSASPNSGGGAPRGPGFGGGGPGGGGGGPRGGGGGGMFGDTSTGRKYNFTLTAQARNLFNNVNYANPIGAITSPLFGESVQLANFGPGGSNANNRRLEFGLRFAF